MERKRACILVTAVDGETKAARSLIGRAIRTALSVHQWHTEPHRVVYASKAECSANDAGTTSRYTLNVTDLELDKLTRELERLSSIEGWNRVPVDIYCD